MTITTTADAIRTILIGVVLVLGTTRATQIILWDRILDRPRQAVLRRFNPRGLTPGDDGLGYVGYLFQCPWCVSVWIGAASVALVAWDWTRPFCVWANLALALSLCAVVTDRLIDRHASDESAARVVSAPVEDPPTAVADALDQEA